MSNVIYVTAAIVGMALITFLLRALPFAAGPWLRRHRVVYKLGNNLPLAIMVLLVAHTAWGHAQERGGLPWLEALAIFVVIVLQSWLRQPLVSIAAGTALYVVALMLL